jgi:hypothetical protein
MAITYTPVAIRGEAVSPIIQEIMFANKTVNKGLVNFADDVKASTIITEARVDVVGQLYTGAALSSSGGPTVKDREATPKKIEYKYTFLYNDLRQSRFNRDMASGAWNIDSDEFNSQVLAMTGPRVSEDAQLKFWAAFSATNKAAIAALVPGAGQGSITAAAQTAVASYTADPAGVDGVLSRVLYDATALGAYIKVTGTTVTAANIAAECAKIYAAIPAASLEGIEMPVIYAPYAWKQLIKVANNAVGAAQQINFLVTGLGDAEVISYNGIVIEFVPIPTGFAYCQRPSVIHWSTDAMADCASFETGKVANDGDTMFVRSIYTLDATVMDQSHGVLYGG